MLASIVDCSQSCIVLSTGWDSIRSSMSQYIVEPTLPLPLLLNTITRVCIWARLFVSTFWHYVRCVLKQVASDIRALNYL